MDTKARECVLKDDSTSAYILSVNRPYCKMNHEYLLPSWDNLEGFLSSPSADCRRDFYVPSLCRAVFVHLGGRPGILGLHLDLFRSPYLPFVSVRAGEILSTTAPSWNERSDRSRWMSNTAASSCLSQSGWRLWTQLLHISFKQRTYYDRELKFLNMRGLLWKLSW